MSLFRKEEGQYKEPPTPFGGFINGKPAITSAHLLVSGPTGRGKSRRVLGPGILMWKGPVVAVSSKPDLIDLCLEQRLEASGYVDRRIGTDPKFDRTFLLDLSGEVPDRILPDGVQRVYVDPVALIGTDDDALDLATILIQSGTAGAGGVQGGKGGGDAFWETQATAPLAAILRAAGKDGIDWALKAVGTVDTDESEEIDEDAEELPPSWSQARARLEHISDLLYSKLSATAALDERMRDSTKITMESAVAPWLRSNVRGQEGAIPFSPSLLEHPAATLFIVAPADGVAAGAAVAVVDFISRRWRANQTEESQLPRLLLVVDELANTMPWPKLPVVVTESRAMGINLLVAVQATSQLAKRYGRDGLTELREVFPAVLLLEGAPEKSMLEHAAWWSGRSERQKTTIDSQGRQSQSSEVSENLHASELLPRDIDHGRLLRGRRPGEKTAREAGILVDLYDISAIPWRKPGSQKAQQPRRRR